MLGLRLHLRIIIVRIPFILTSFNGRSASRESAISVASSINCFDISILLKKKLKDNFFNESKNSKYLICMY